MAGSARVVGYGLKILQEGGRMRFGTFLVRWRDRTHMAVDPHRLARLAANAAVQNLVVQGYASCESPRVAVGVVSFKEDDELWLTPKGEAWLAEYKGDC